MLNATKLAYIAAQFVVRPSQSKPDTEPQLPPALLRLSAMISEYFTRGHYARLRLAGNVIETHEHAGDFKEF